MKKIKKFLYTNSPYWIQNILISYYGRQLIKERYGKVYFREFEKLKSKDSSDLAKELENQSREVRNLVKYAAEHSPFYKEKYKDFDLSKIVNTEDLKMLPVITKEEIRKHLSKIYTIEEIDGIVSYTGGTTGKSLKVLFTDDDMQKRMAYLDYFKYRAGVENIFTVKKASFGARLLTTSKAKSRFWRFNKPYNQRLYSTYHLNEENFPSYVEDLQKFKPETLNGFVSAIYDIAQFIDNNNIILQFKPIAIFTTSETLLDFHREKIERVFKCKVYDQYASSEGAPFITECVKGNLHYNIDTGVIEQAQTDASGIGNMIVTSFTTYGTPLIRYDIQDRIAFSSESCDCGLSHPLVEKIDGRQVDYLLATNGTKITTSSLSAVIKGVQNSVKKIQFVQNEKHSIDVFLVFEKEKFNEKERKLLINAIKYRFGDDIKINLEFKKDIEREKSGKYAFIKNNL